MGLSSKLFDLIRVARRIASSIVCMFAWLLLATAAYADIPVGHDQKGWDHTAAIARKALSLNETGRHRFTTDEWEDLRLTLTVERQLALNKAEQGSLDTRILSAQLAELGPQPAGAARDRPSVPRGTARPG